MTLMVDWNAETTSREELAVLELPVQETETYVPVPHIELLDMVTTRAAQHNLTITGEQHCITPDGGSYFGILQVTGGLISADMGYSFMIGIRNNLKKLFRAMLLSGNRVFICSNGCFSGEIEVGHKHTKNIRRELPGMVDEALSRVIDVEALQVARYEAYKESLMTTAEADHMIMEMLRREHVNVTRIAPISKEWETPSYDHGEKSAWRLLQAVTESMKGAPVHDVPKRTIGAQEVLDEFCEFEYAQAA